MVNQKLYIYIFFNFFYDLFSSKSRTWSRIIIIIFIKFLNKTKSQKKVIFCFQMPRKYDSNLRLVRGRHSTAAFEGLILHLVARLQSPQPGAATTAGLGPCLAQFSHPDPTNHCPSRGGALPVQGCSGPSSARLVPVILPGL